MQEFLLVYKHERSFKAKRHTAVEASRKKLKSVHKGEIQSNADVIVCLL
jgi:hypothetical protein